MRYLKDEDNRYRVNFMIATEEMMDTMTVAQFISYLEENAEFEDNDTMYLDGHIVDTKVYMLRETKDLRKEFIVTEDGRVFYWLSVVQKIELVDTEVPEAKAEMPKMSESVRINNHISDIRNSIESYREQYAQTGDEDLLITIYELEVGIGECEGALLEMAEVDGCDDPFEYFG